MSSFGSLTIGQSALYAHRKALDVTGHNLANVNTPGYSRQRVDLVADSGPITPALHSSWQGTGEGVRAGPVIRIRDEFLDLRAQQEHATDASLRQTQTVLSRIELAVAEPGDTGLAAQMSGFLAAWDDVANRPDDLSARAQLVEHGTSLATGFAQLESTLQTMGRSSTSELQSVVADVNSVAQRVAELNQRIKTNVAAELPSADLLDQRDLLVDQLSEQVGVTSRSQADGTVDLYIGTNALVRGNQTQSLAVDTPTTAAGTVSVVWAASGSPAGISGQSGALQSAINTTIVSYRTQLTAVTQKLTDDVSAVHVTGFDLGGNPGQNFFVMGPNGMVVNGAIAADPSKVAAAATATGGRDGSIAAKVADLTAPGDTYRSFVQRLGVQSQSVNRQTAAQATVTGNVDAARNASSGVNIDEEMTNLIQIQHAYDAAARFITAVDSMLETLIKGTGLVGR